MLGYGRASNTGSHERINLKSKYETKPMCYLKIQNTLIFSAHDILYSDSKEFACIVGDLGSIPELGRSPGVGNGNPLQYSCLENSTDRGGWQAIVHGVAKSWLSD